MFLVSNYHSAVCSQVSVSHAHTTSLMCYALFPVISLVQRGCTRGKSRVSAFETSLHHFVPELNLNYLKLIYVSNSLL